MKPAYARLHVLLAREAPIGLVIRHGTAKSACTLLWDRERDRFTLGQWMRGHIELDRCDLSPDGRHFLYSARRYVNAVSEVRQWTVVSRTPYLKAVAFYPSRVSGGWFLNDRDYCIVTRGQHAEDRESPEVHRVEAEKPEPSLYAARMQRAGWTLEDRRQEFAGRLELFRDAAAGWELRQPAAYGWERRKAGGYRLSREATFAPTRDWEWAEVDGKRLAWAAKGCLWAGVLRKGGLDQVKLLHDFNGMKFEAIEAPYEGGRPVMIAPPPAPSKPSTPRREPLLKRPRKPRRGKPDRSRTRVDEDE